MEPLDFLEEATPGPSSPVDITLVAATIISVVVLLILVAGIATFCLVRNAQSGGEYIRGDRVQCYRDPESPSEEGTVELVIPQRNALCRGQPEYSIVFDKDSHRGCVPAQQILQKIGHAECGDKASLAVLTSYEARSLVSEIIDESTSGESGKLSVPSAKVEAEESGSTLVESVLQTVNDMMMNSETTPLKLQDSISEGYGAEGYTDRDEGYVDKEDGYMDNLVDATVNQVLLDRRTDHSETDMMDVNAPQLVDSLQDSASEGYTDAGYADRDEEAYADHEKDFMDNLVEETVRQVLDDRRADEREEGVMDDIMDANAAQLVESVLRIMDDEDETSMATTSAAQNVVNDLMQDVWTGDVADDASPSGSNSDNDSVSEQSREFVDGVVNSLNADSDNDSVSEQSREFVDGVVNSLNADSDNESVSEQSREFVDGVVNSLNADSHNDSVPEQSREIVDGVVNSLNADSDNDSVSEQSREFIDGVVNSLNADSQNDSVPEQSRELVDGVVNSLNADSDNDSVSEQSREFVHDVLQDLGVEDD